MIIRFFRFLALLWYADEHGWPEKEQLTPTEPSGTAPASYIHVRRHELGLSLEEVASRAGSSKTHIWALERRRSKNPTLWLILALCDALQCSLNALIGEDVSQPFYTESEMALIDAHRKIFTKPANGSDHG